MRKLFIILAVIAALVIIAVLALPAFLDVNRYHDRIQAELQERLNRPVTLGTLRLSLLPFAIRVDNTMIGEDPRFPGGRPFAQVEQLYVSAKLLPLLRGEIEVGSLELRKPRVELIRNQQGVWNFESLGKKKAAGAEPQPRELVLANLKILDGQVAITDFKERQSRTVYDHLDLEVSGYAPDREFSLAVAAHLPGEGKQMLKLEGKAGPIAEQPTATPFDGTLRLDQVSLAALQKFLNSEALSGINATASGEMDVENKAGRIASNGSLKLQDLRIRGTEVGYPITADYNLVNDLDAKLLSIEKATLKLGSTPISITGTVNTGATPAQIDLRVKASNVSIEEAARLAAASGVAFNPGMNISGRLTADVHAQGSAQQPALNGALKVQDVNVAGKGLPQPVRMGSVELQLSPQAIRSNSFSASTGGTTVTAQFTLAQYTTPKSNLDLTLRTVNARVGELLNIAQAYGVSAVEGMTGSGSITLDLRASGPLKDSAAMAYTGSGSLESASLNLPQLTQPLQVRNASIRFSQNSIVLENMAATLGQTNASGTFTLRNFAAPQVQFNLNADKINASEWQQMFSPAAPQKRAETLGLVPAAHAAGSEQSLLAKATGTGSLAIGTLLYDQLTLTNVRSTVTLDRGLIRLSPITADLYGGRELGAVIIDTRSTPTTYTVSSKLQQVDANKLLSSVSSLKQTLYGLLAANADTKFTATSSDQIARSLNGTVSLNLKDGKIANMDLLYELASIGKFLTFGRGAQPFTSIAQLTGNFDVRNGLARTDDLKATINGGTLAAAGTVNLADQSLNMRVTAVLSKVMSEQVGGTQVGGFMSTALANSRGELVIPVIVSGSFSQPRFAPDVQKLAEMKLQNLLPTSNNPGQLTTGILGAVLGGKKSGQASGEQGGLQGILGGLTGQRKQQQQQPNAQQRPAGKQPQPDPLQQVMEGLLGQKKKQQPQQQQDQKKK